MLSEDLKKGIESNPRNSEWVKEAVKQLSARSPSDVYRDLDILWDYAKKRLDESHHNSVIVDMRFVSRG